MSNGDRTRIPIQHMPSGQFAIGDDRGGPDDSTPDMEPVPNAPGHWRPVSLQYAHHNRARRDVVPPTARPVTVGEALGALTGHGRAAEWVSPFDGGSIWRAIAPFDAFDLYRWRESVKAWEPYRRSLLPSEMALPCVYVSDVNMKTPPVGQPPTVAPEVHAVPTVTRRQRVTPADPMLVRVVDTIAECAARHLEAIRAGDLEYGAARLRAAIADGVTAASGELDAEAERLRGMLGDLASLANLIDPPGAPACFEVRPEMVRQVAKMLRLVGQEVGK